MNIEDTFTRNLAFHPHSSALREPFVAHIRRSRQGLMPAHTFETDTHISSCTREPSIDIMASIEGQPHSARLLPIQARASPSQVRIPTPYLLTLLILSPTQRSIILVSPKQALPAGAARNALVRAPHATSLPISLSEDATLLRNQ